MVDLVVEPRWIWSADRGLLQDHYLVIHNGRIAAVTPERPGGDLQRVTLPDGLAIPGLVNLHNHAFSAPLFRGMTDDLPSDALGGNIIYSLLMPLGDIAVEVLDPDEIGDAAEMALVETLKGGATTVVDIWRLQQEAFIDRAKALGIRGYSCPYLFSTPNLNIGPDGKPVYRTDGPIDTGFERTVALFQRHDEGHTGMTRIGFGPHGLDSCTPEFLQAVDRKAAELGTTVAIHCAQSLPELQIVRERWGKSPIEHLRDIGLLSPRLIVAHCVYATDADLEILRAHEVTIASCPLTFLRSGVPVPVDRFLASGVRLGFGTDGYGLDMLAELRIAGAVAKSQSQRGDVASAARLLTAATRDSAKAIGRSDLGTFAPGAAADLLVLDLGKSRYQPVWDPLKTFLWNATAADIDTIIVDGKLLQQGGRLLGVDERRITERGGRAIEKAWRTAIERGLMPASIAAAFSR